TCEYGCSLQHHCLLLAAAARTHSPVGQFAVARVDAHRTRSYLPLVHSVFVSGHRRATDLDWSVPANDREAVDLRAAVCGMDCLFAGGRGYHRIAGGPARDVNQ